MDQILTNAKAYLLYLNVLLIKLQFVVNKEVMQGQMDYVIGITINRNVLLQINAANC